MTSFFYCSRQQLWRTVSAIAFLVVFAWVVSVQSSQAATVNDSYISAVTVSSSSTTPSAVATYTVTFTTTATITSGYGVEFNLQTATGCRDEDYNNCNPNLGSATMSGLTATIVHQEGNNLNVNLTADLPAGTHTVTFANVTNPRSAVALRAAVATPASDEAALLGSAYSTGNWYSTLSNEVVNIGTVVVSGTVTAGSTPVSSIWTEIHNADWSVNKGTGTDDKGYYAIFQDYEGVSYWTSGTYTASAFAQEGSGYITTQKDFTYAGSAVTNDIVLTAAEYFFSGTVVYGETSNTVSASAGDPVTNANVCFNDASGKGSYCDATDSNGQYSVAVNVGNYNAYVSANVDWHDPVAVAAVDWQYEGSNTVYSMSSKGTQTVNFDVEATTAIVTGTVAVPNSTEALDGSVGFTNSSSNYWGSVTDGSYSLNLNPGKYEVWFYPDTKQNTAWGQYSYKGIATISEGSNTHDIVVQQLTGTVVATVTTEDGAPVSDIQVQAWTQDHWTSAQTNSSGQATLYIAADAWYEVSVWDETYLLDGSFEKVNVSDGGSTSVNFTVQLPDATITATITKSDGTIPEELHGWFGCETEDHQSHYGEDLRNGTVELGVAVNDTTGVFEGNCHVWLPDQADGVASGQAVTVERNGTAELSFTLQALDATVSTTVKNFATGKKIEEDGNLNVTLWNEVDQLWHESTLETNPVSIPVVANKTYTGGVWSRSSDYLPLWSMNSDTVNVASGETGTLVLNVMKKDGTLRLEVTDPDGNAVDHGWAWCGNWEEVNFALDTAATNLVIDTGAEIRDGVAEVPLVSGHSYRCGVGAPTEFIDQGWLSPTEQEVEYKSTNDTLKTLKFQFNESDATLQGGIKIASEAQTSALQGVSDLDSIWCWAWSEGGSSWTEVDPGEDYRLNLSTAHSGWSAGCDAVLNDTWYFTEEPYEFTPEQGKNSHDFTLKKMGSWKMYEPINETFDATENKVITYGDGTRLTIPSGTLATSGNVTVRGTPETNIIRTDDHPLTIPVDWEAFDENDNLIETFPGGNVTIEIPYTDEALAEFGVDEDSLVGKYWDELSGSWKSPDNVTINKDSNIITITTSHFSQYGATYNARIGQMTAPEAPSVTVSKIKQHSAKLLLRTKQTSALATRFIVQIRQAGNTARKSWKNATVKNKAEHRRVLSTLQKLKGNTSYQLRVKACNSAGCSDVTKWYDFRTK